MSCEMQISLGAFVLHSLESEDALAVEQHLTACATCSEEARELAFTASLLALLTPEQAAQLEADDDAEQRGPTAGPRRRIRRAAAVLVATVLALGASVPVVGMLRDAPPSGRVVSRADAATHVRAAVTLAGAGAGTRLRLSMTGAPPGGWCALVAHSRGGRTDTAASWTTDAHGAADVSGTTDIAPDRLRALDVVTDTGRVLVRIRVPDPPS